MSLSSLKIEVEEVDEDRLTAVIDLATDSEAFMVQALFLVIRAHCFKYDIPSSEFMDALRDLDQRAGVKAPISKVLN